MFRATKAIAGRRWVSQLAQSVSKGTVKVSSTPEYTAFSFGDSTYSYHNAFLRDCSDCKTSLDGATGQKLFTTGEIVGVYPVAFELIDGPQVLVKWSDGDECVYTRDFLERHSTREKSFEGRYHEDEVCAWDKSHEKTFPQLPRYDYESYINNDETVSPVVKDLHRFGLAVVSNTPKLSDAEHDRDPLVAKIAERIGYIKSTFYGTTFDVKSKPDATNIAYTSKFLPLHQDLCYYESPPGLQLLHCIKNRATGGENVFADGFAAARHVQESDPQAYQALLTVPINFHFNREGHHYFHSRCLVVEDTTLPNKDKSNMTHLKETNYSPPFQAPFDMDIVEQGSRGVFQDFLRGMKLFESYINDPKNKIKFKTSEDSCVLFDNRRVLHARDEFDAHSGERWLKGCYVDKDAFQSKVRAVNIGLL